MSGDELMDALMSSKGTSGNLKERLCKHVSKSAPNALGDEIWANDVFFETVKLLQLDGETLISNLKFYPIFVTGTDTDVGKTFVSSHLALMFNMLITSCRNYKVAHAKCLQLNESDLADTKLDLAVGYYKAATSGAKALADSDGGLIKERAGLKQDPDSLTSYLYEEAVSPHLAAVHQGENISKDKVLSDFDKIYHSSNLTIIEGSGGIYCPLSYEGDYFSEVYQRINSDKCFAMNSNEPSKMAKRFYTICDFMKEVAERCGAVSVVVVSDSNVGCINKILTTVNALRQEGVDLSHAGVVMTNFDPYDYRHIDNLHVIEQMSNLPVIFTVENEPNPDVESYFAALAKGEVSAKLQEHISKLPNFHDASIYPNPGSPIKVSKNYWTELAATLKSLVCEVIGANQAYSELISHALMHPRCASGFSCSRLLVPRSKI